MLFLRKLKINFIMSSFLIMMSAQAETVKPTFVQSATAINESSPKPIGLVLSPDGTKMYLLNGTNDTIYQYTLTTAWNVGTGNSSLPTTLYSVSSKETYPYCFCLSPDGTKLLVGGTTGKGIDEFTLSTAHNISTASYVRFKEIRYTYTNNLPFVSFFNSGIQYHTDGCIIYVVDAIAGGLSLHGLLT